jgi:hypothetical protein
VPPLTGVAVNVTCVPAHILVAFAVIVTLTGRIGLTVIDPVVEIVPHPPVNVIE